MTIRHFLSTAIDPLTPDAINSEWVGNEILYASNAQKTIIPLHLKKCDILIGFIKKQY